MRLKLLPLLLDTQMGLRLLPEGSWEQLLHNGLVLSPLLHRQLLLPYSALLGGGGGVAAEPIKVVLGHWGAPATFGHVPDGGLELGARAQQRNTEPLPNRNAGSSVCCCGEGRLHYRVRSPGRFGQQLPEAAAAAAALDRESGAGG